MSTLEIILSVAFILLALAYRKLYNRHRRTDRSLQISQQIRKHNERSYDLYEERAKARYKDLHALYITEVERTAEYIKAHTNAENEKLKSELNEVKAKLSEYETNADEELADLIKNSYDAI